MEWTIFAKFKTKILENLMDEENKKNEYVFLSNIYPSQRKRNDEIKFELTRETNKKIKYNTICFFL